MNRPQELDELSQDTWETELEEAFFDAPLPRMATLEPAPPREPASVVPVEPIPTPVQPVPLRIAEPVVPSAPQAVTREPEVVVQVVPRWVWPTVVGSALMGVAGVAFALGVVFATPASGPATPPPVPVEAAAPPPEDAARVEVVPEEAPAVVEKVERRVRPKPAPARVPSRAAPVAEPTPSAPKVHIPAPVVPAIPDDSGEPATPAESVSTPLRPGDLPKAVSLGALAPGSAL